MLNAPWAALQVKLVDAGFVWTEPHSRRIKVKLTVQAEVMNGAILQQTFVVEYVVEPHMCMDCTRANTNTSVWTACAQVCFSVCVTLLFIIMITHTLSACSMLTQVDFCEWLLCANTSTLQCDYGVRTWAEARHWRCKRDCAMSNPPL